MAASRTLFRILRDRIQQVDQDRAVINCMTCQESRCCREYDVFVEAQDVARLAEHFGTTEAQVAKKYLDEKPDWTGDYKFRLRKVKDDVGELCSFLKRDKKSGQMRCSAYAARPNLCRTFDERDCTLYDDNGRML
jgi:Fe-S-cluster containining protein